MPSLRAVPRSGEGPNLPSAFFNSLSYDLSCGEKQRRSAQFSKIQSAVKINNALGNFDVLVIYGLRKLNPQCKPIHVKHIEYVQSPSTSHTALTRDAARSAFGSGGE
jgi:hypothetical protein